MKNENILENYINGLKGAIDKLELESINDLVDQIIITANQNGRIYICGNGGSASTASHFTVDIMKGVITNRSNFLDVTCLNDNIPIVTAFANDVSYEEVFSSQLIDRINQKDLLIVISGSGNSQNIINAVNIAIREESRVFGLLGFDGGRVGKLISHKIIIKSNNMQIIEDIHLSVVHMLLVTLNSRTNPMNK
jgi:D-sedoheptulose 7-phosphate isomerase